ncbi:hypothetical protein BC826DRAFT_1174487 [Russula brevipes]|nr:hypothetical protein BC826DRAFT_1174487 [Russula brevipes]
MLTTRDHFWLRREHMKVGTTCKFPLDGGWMLNVERRISFNLNFTEKRTPSLQHVTLVRFGVLAIGKLGAQDRCTRSGQASSTETLAIMRKHQTSSLPEPQLALGQDGQHGKGIIRTTVLVPPEKLHKYKTLYLLAHLGIQSDLPRLLVGRARLPIPPTAPTPKSQGKNSAGEEDRRHFSGISHSSGVVGVQRAALMRGRAWDPAQVPGLGPPLADGFVKWTSKLSAILKLPVHDSTTRSTENYKPIPRPLLAAIEYAIFKRLRPDHGFAISPNQRSGVPIIDHCKCSIYSTASCLIGLDDVSVDDIRGGTKPVTRLVHQIRTVVSYLTEISESCFANQFSAKTATWNIPKNGFRVSIFF